MTASVAAGGLSFTLYNWGRDKTREREVSPQRLKQGIKGVSPAVLERMRLLYLHYPQLRTHISATASRNFPVAYVDKIIPATRDYYRFSGSLTTPPCSEGVRWLVLKAAATTSKAQVDAFSKLMRHANNRPLQALNARMVLE